MLETLTLLPTLEEIVEAQKLIYSLMQPTPQISWPLLNQRFDAKVWVKHENHTPIGAFKARTAVVYAAELFKKSSGIKGLITATRGNHGQSVALAGQRFDVPVTIVVPHGNSKEKNAAPSLCSHRHGLWHFCRLRRPQRIESQNKNSWRRF